MVNLTLYLTVLVSWLLFCTAGLLEAQQDSTVTENIEIRVFNHDYRATVDEVLHTLDRAHLELRGFTKSIINKSVTTADEKPVYSTVLHYDKTVPCKQLMFVEQEIRTLLPEVWGVEVSRRVVSTVSRARLCGGKICTAGIEIHLPPPGGCAKRKVKRSACEENWCMFCFRSSVIAY